MVIEDAVVHPVEPAPLPQVRDIVVRVGISLLIAVIVPGVLFATATAVFSVTLAMIVAIGWMAGVMSWRVATGRCVSALLVLTGTIMTVKTAITFATGNTFVYFVQPVFVDVAVSAVFLGSLWSARPIVERLAPDFCPLTSELAARPRIRRLLRSLTLMWGVVIMVKAGVTLWLLISLSTVDFVLIKSGSILTLTAAAVAATIVWSVVVCRKEGLFALSGRDLAPVPG